MKPGLTLARHLEIGARLKAIRDELLSLHVEIANAYARSRPVVSRSDSAHNAVDRLRSELEEEGFREHGDAFDVRVYYGTREPKAGE